MNTTSRLLALFLLVGSIPLTAQRTVIVDAANGPGTTYTTLAAAFTGMLANDVVIVRAGTYTGTSASVGVSFVMLGEGSPLVVPAASAVAALRITLNGSQYQRIAIKGMRFQSQTTGQWALNVRTNYNFWPAPTVHIEDCEALSISTQADRLGLLAESVGLTVQRCNLNTSQVSDCLATFVESTIRGHDQSLYQGQFSQHAQTALDVIRSEVWIVDSTVVAGSSNGIAGTPASCIGFSDNSFTTASRLYLSGACTLAADPSPHPTWPAPLVFQNYAYFYPLWPTVEREPGVVLVPSPLGGTFGPSITQVTRTIPHLRATTAPLGGVMSCTVHGAQNDFAALLAGFTTYPHRTLGHAMLLADTAAVTVGFAILPASLEAVFPLSVPNDVALRGLVFEASAALLSPLGAIDATNPVSGTVH